MVATSWSRAVALATADFQMPGTFLVDGQASGFHFVLLFEQSFFSERSSVSLF